MQQGFEELNVIVSERIMFIEKFSESRGDLVVPLPLVSRLTIHCLACHDGLAPRTIADPVRVLGHPQDPVPLPWSPARFLCHQNYRCSRDHDPVRIQWRCQRHYLLRPQHLWPLG